jgi:hypothetical protein
MVPLPFELNGDRVQYLPDWGEANLTATALGQTRTGPACMRLVLSDYGQGETLTLQLTNNPNAPQWDDSHAAFNVAMEVDQFDPAPLRNGGLFTYEQGFPISGYSNPQPGFPRQPGGFAADRPYLNSFSTGNGEGVFVSGHHLNTSITLDVTDAGMFSATGTFTLSTRGGSYEGDVHVGLQEVTASGDFTIPINRMGPMEDLALWRRTCFIAVFEGRIHDAIPCARAHPDPAVFEEIAFAAILSATTMMETFIDFTPEELATGFLSEADLFRGR